MLVVAGLSWLIGATDETAETPTYPNVTTGFREPAPVVPEKKPIVFEDTVPFRQVLPGPYNLMKISRDGRVVTGAQPGKPLQSWDTRTMQQIGMRAAINGTTSNLAFSSDNKWIAGVDYSSTIQSRKLFLVSGIDGHQRWLEPPPMQSYWSCPPAMAQIKSSGKTPEVLVACGTNFGQIFLYNGQGQKVGVMGAMPKPQAFDRARNIRTIALSPDGRLLAAVERNTAVSRDDVLYIWDIAAKKRKISVPLKHSSDHMQFTNQGKLAMLQWGEQTIRLWDVSSGKQLREISPRIGSSITAFRFSPDGKQLAVANDWMLRLYDVSNSSEPEMRYLKSGTDAGAVDIAFTTDEKSILFVTRNAPSLYRWKLK